ncbi:MAG: ATP-binding cassette domain-containing protein [Roseiarcus sp.]|jgi:phospholipid/cholesterol/gamma-HCH transport system ATP-binding protein
MEDASAPNAIEVADLVVEFAGKRVLDHLSLDVRTGEILGLVGASGGGKSVLLRTMLGLIPKRQGRIAIFGVDQDKATLQELQTLERRWGVLYQQGALFSSLSVFQNIEFPIREYLRIPQRLMREIATAKLEMVGLKSEDGEKHPSELSGGMTNRVALARALALDPAIVFLDEPTSGLDPIAAGEFGVLIQTLQRTLGLTVFMVTHDIVALRTICDRIAALAEGKIVAIGSMSQVLETEDPWVKSYFRSVRSAPSSAPATP